MSNYFRFGQTTVRHIGILLPVLILTVSPYSACHCALGCQISSKSVHPQRYVISMAAAAAQFYFWLRISWRHCLQNVRICQQTKFLSYNSIHSWDRTISGVEKQTSAILEFYFRFRFRSYHRTAVDMSFCTSLQNVYIEVVLATPEVCQSRDIQRRDFLKIQESQLSQRGRAMPRVVEYFR